MVALCFCLFYDTLTGSLRQQIRHAVQRHTQVGGIIRSWPAGQQHAFQHLPINEGELFQLQAAPQVEEGDILRRADKNA